MSEGQDRDRGEQGEHRQEAQDGGPADVLAALGVARVDAGALDPEEDEDGDQQGALDLLEQRLTTGQVVATGQVVGERPRVEEEDRQHHEERQGHDLGHRDHGVDRRGLLDTAPDQQEEAPDRGRGHQEGDPGVARAEQRLQVGEQLGQGRHDQDPVEGVARAGRRPETDGGEETGIDTEPGARVGVDPVVDVRPADREVLEDEGQHQHARPGDAPGDERAVDARLAGEPCRQLEDAGTDHRSDDHGGEGWHRQGGGPLALRSHAASFGRADEPSASRLGIPQLAVVAQEFQTGRSCGTARFVPVPRICLATT